MGKFEKPTVNEAERMGLDPEQIKFHAALGRIRPVPRDLIGSHADTALAQEIVGGTDMTLAQFEISVRKNMALRAAGITGENAADEPKNIH